MLVSRGTSQIDIHLPQPGGSNIRWRLKKSSSESDPPNYNGWSIQGVSEASLSGNVSTEIKKICDTGNVEIAMSRTGDGNSFRIGGKMHGNDMMIGSPLILCDGVAVSLPGSGVEPCATFEFFHRSQLLDPDTEQPYAKRYTWYRFEGGDLYIQNIITDFQDEVSFRTIYMAMLPLLRDASPSGMISHSGARSPLFSPVEDMDGAFTSTATTAHMLKAWGDRYSAEVEMVEGWDKPGRKANFVNNSDRNKIYFDFTGPDYTPQIGESLVSRARYRISIYD